MQIPEDFIAFPVDMFCVSREYQDYIDHVMLPEGLIKNRVERLARDILADCHRDPLVILCVLKGAYRFFTDLLQYLQALNRHSDKSVLISVEFIRLQSYVDDSSSGDVKMFDSQNLKNLSGKNVLVVEDIIDTGKTMSHLLSALEQYKPANIKVASLLVKRTSQGVAYNPDYAGFFIPDRFVIGYGLDYNEYFRDLSHICVINDAGKKKFRSH